MADIFGVLYVIIDSLEYRDYAVASIFSLRKSGYSGSITCLVNFNVLMPDWLCVDSINIEVSGNGVFVRSRSIKTTLNLLTPYAKTLYLDCDTLVLGNIEKLLFQHIEFSVAPDIKTVLGNVHSTDVSESTEELNYTLSGFNKEAVYYSTSTILWQKLEDSDRLFGIWHNEWKKYQRVDQLALARALQITGIEVDEMDIAYNFPSIRAISYRDAITNGAIIYAVWGRQRKEKVLQYADDNNFRHLFQSI